MGHKVGQAFLPVPLADIGITARAGVAVGTCMREPPLLVSAGEDGQGKNTLRLTLAQTANVVAGVLLIFALLEAQRKNARPLYPYKGPCGGDRAKKNQFTVNAIDVFCFS